MPEEGRPKTATAAILLMIVAGVVGIVLGLYFILYGGNAFGGLIFLLLGAVYAFGGRALQRGESWGWGAGVISAVFVFLFGFFLLWLSLVFIVFAICAVVPLYLSREYYGMVRPDPEQEKRRRAELEAARTANPEGLHCKRCGGTKLWVAPDGSAYCTDCKTGILSVKSG